MKNFSQTGKLLDLTAPAAGVVSGKALIVGSLFVVPQADAAGGEIFAGLAEGVVEIDKLAADVVAEGAKLNWDDTAKHLKLAAGDLDGVATAVKAAGNGVTSVFVKLTQI